MYANLKKVKNRVLLNLSIALLAGLLFAGCQSSVRFSSADTNIKNQSGKSTSNKTEKKSKKKDSEREIAGKNEIQFTNVSQEAILKEAEDWIGTPYVWGGTTKDGVDCSGFVMNIYKKFGLNLPRTASMQYDFSKHIDEDDLETGDLLFFKEGDRISHVGIYIGNSTMIHASSTYGVIKQPLQNYPYFNREDKFAGYGKVLH